MVLSSPVTAAPRWRNRQTRRSQKPMSARTCGFDSRSRHQVQRLDYRAPSVENCRWEHGTASRAGAWRASQLAVCAYVARHERSEDQALGGVPLFARCSKKELEFFASRTDECPRRPASLRARARRPTLSVYCLMVRLTSKSMAAIAARSESGTTSARSACWIEVRRARPVVTRTPARLMVMSHSQFRDAIKANDTLLSQAIAAMAGRLRADSLAREADQS